MNKSALLAFAALSAVAGCSFAARSPDMFRDDTKKLFETKHNEMKACYDGVLKGTPGAAGKVTVHFTWEKSTGALQNPAVDPAATTAPAPVQECVTKHLGGLVMNPADAREGQGTWAFDFALIVSL